MIGYISMTYLSQLCGFILFKKTQIQQHSHQCVGTNNNKLDC